MSKVNFLLIVFFTILLFLALSNSLVSYLDIYSTFNWVIDYRYGFCKRGMLGFLYHMYSYLVGTDLNYGILERDIFTAQVLLSLLSCVFLVVLFIDTLKKLESKFEVFCIFVFLVSSFFVKNVFSLTGYIDLWIFNFFLVILILLARNFVYSSMILACFSCFFTELGCVFWWSVLAAYWIKYGFTKKSFALLIPLVVGFTIHSFGVPTDHLIEFYKEFSFSLNISIQEGINGLFSQQYDLKNYIPERLNFILSNFMVVLLSFLILGGISFIYFIHSLSFLKLGDQTLVNKILIVVLAVSAVFGTLLLNLVSIDFWRFVGFSIFSAFIFVCSFVFLSTEGEKKELSCSLTFFKTVVLSLGLAISALTLILPPMRSFGTYFMVMTPTIFDYMGGGRSFILEPFIVDNDLFYTALGKFNFDNSHNLYLKQDYSDILCFSEGNKFPGSLQTYGKTKIIVESKFDPDDVDEFKFIQIFDYRIQVPRDAVSEYVLDFSPSVVAKYPRLIINIEPSSSSWIMKKIDIQHIN
jgi:hypothetical protein